MSRVEIIYVFIKTAVKSVERFVRYEKLKVNRMVLRRRLSGYKTWTSKILLEVISIVIGACEQDINFQRP